MPKKSLTSPAFLGKLHRVDHAKGIALERQRVSRERQSPDWRCLAFAGLCKVGIAALCGAG